MSLEDTIQKSAEVLLQRLRQADDTLIQSLFAELVESARRERSSLLDEARRTVEAEAARKWEAERTKLRAEAEQTRAAELQAARATADQALKEGLAAARVEADQARTAEVREAREKEFQRLLASVGALDQATSLGQVLDMLADRAAGEAPRVAVLVVQGTRVCGWRFVGFPNIRDAPSVDLAVDESGLIGRAIREGRACSGPVGPGAPAGSLPAFAASPEHRATQAVPVRVGGRVTAVVYADEAAQSSERLPTSWASAIQILAHHAGHCLEVLTALHVSQFADSGQLALTEPPPVAAAERPPVAAERQPVDDTEDAARRYARLLVSEIKLYNETVVTAGREQRDLFERLRPEIERARVLYEARVSPSLRARNLYFEQELVRTLADGDPNLLGG